MKKKFEWGVVGLVLGVIGVVAVVVVDVGWFGARQFVFYTICGQKDVGVGDGRVDQGEGVKL